MCTSLLLVGGTFALNNPQPWRWSVWVLLVANQIVKLLYMEQTDRGSKSTIDAEPLPTINSYDYSLAWTLTCIVGDALLDFN